MSAPTGDLARLFSDRRLNAGIGWGIVAFTVAVAIGELVVGDLLSVVFTLGVAALAVVPPVARRDPWLMLPWEVIAMASLPAVGRAFATWPLAGVLATYLAVAAVALMLAVQLHAFTPVRMTYGFAVLFVVVTTMAAAGVWAVVRWIADLQLGTGFLGSEKALMWEFVYSTVAGLVAGAVFRVYFRREPFDERIPEHSVDPTGPGGPPTNPGGEPSTDAGGEGTPPNPGGGSSRDSGGESPSTREGKS